MNLKQAEVNQGLKPAGVFTLKHFRGGVQIGEDVISPNLVVDQGKDYFSNTCLNDSDAAEGNWYLALYGDNTAPASNDTAALVASRLNELNAEISEVTRPAWTPNAGNTGANSSNSDAPAVFTMASDDTIYGAYMISNNTKAGTTGVLLAVSLFASARTVFASDVLQLTYTIQLT